MESLTFLAILGFCAAVLIWYTVNTGSDKPGLIGLLALRNDEDEDIHHSTPDDPHKLTRVRLKARHSPDESDQVVRRRYRKKEINSSQRARPPQDLDAEEEDLMLNPSRYTLKDNVRAIHDMDD